MESMKIASSAGVETFLSRVPSSVCSIKNIGIVVGACVRMHGGAVRLVFESEGVSGGGTCSGVEQIAAFAAGRDDVGADGEVGNLDSSRGGGQ